MKEEELQGWETPNRTAKKLNIFLRKKQKRLERAKVSRQTAEKVSRNQKKATEFFDGSRQMVAKKRSKASNNNKHVTLLAFPL